MVNILIADDHPVVRRGLKNIIATQYENASLDEARNNPETLDMASNRNYDLIILGTSIPGPNGIDTLEKLKQESPSCPVLMFSSFPEGYAIAAFKAGASGYLSKDCEADELTLAIDKILNGGKYISATIEEHLVSLIQQPRQAPYDILSPHEFHVLCLVASGKDVADIAEELSITASELSKCRSRIFKKIGIRNNIELAKYAAEHNMVG